MPATAPSPSATELVDLLERTFDQSRRVIEAVRPEQASAATPCAAFDVRALVNHMLFAAERIGVAGRRQPVPDQGPAQADCPDDRWVPTFRRVAADAVSAWSAPRAFDGDIVLPFGTFPATTVATIYIVEQATHAGDLAQAVGARRLLDPALAEAALPLAVAVIRPEYRGDEPMPFGAEVTVADDAPAIDRLAAFMGRRPGNG